MSGLRFIRAEKLLEDVMTETAGLGVHVVLDEGGTERSLYIDIHIPIIDIHTHCIS